jgi:hypothetical protein
MHLTAKQVFQVLFNGHKIKQTAPWFHFHQDIEEGLGAVEGSTLTQGRPSLKDYRRRRVIADYHKKVVFEPTKVKVKTIHFKIHVKIALTESYNKFLGPEIFKYFWRLKSRIVGPLSENKNSDSGPFFHAEEGDVRFGTT